MFKKLIVLFCIAIFAISCNKQFEAAIKSTDKDFILETANQMYEQGKWSYAIELYSKINSAFSGTEHAPNILFNSAQANYNDKNYRLAAHQFKNFYITNPLDPRAEEAAFKSAYAFYIDSPKYNLDQTSTYSAITELQSFINAFPDSERAKEANGYINELRDKLEKKYFEIAKIHYKTMKYKAAALSFDNFIHDYPDTKYREEAMMFSLRSKAELALNYSRFDLKESRIQEATTQHKLFTKAYPTSKFKNEADKLLEKLNNDLDKHKTLAAKIAENKK